MTINNTLEARKKAFRKSLAALDDRFFEGYGQTFWMVKFDVLNGSTTCEIGRFNEDLETCLNQLGEDYFKKVAKSKARIYDERAVLIRVRVDEEPHKKFEMPVECE